MPYFDLRKRNTSICIYVYIYKLTWKIQPRTTTSGYVAFMYAHARASLRGSMVEAFETLLLLNENLISFISLLLSLVVFLQRVASCQCKTNLIHGSQKTRMILDDVAFLEQWLYFNQEHIFSYIFPLWVFEAKSRWLHNTRWCAKARSISCYRLASPTGHQMCSNMRLGETKLDQSEGKGCQNITEIIRVSIDLAPPRSRKHPSRNSVCSWRLWKDDGSETMQLASDIQMRVRTHTRT